MLCPLPGIVSRWSVSAVARLTAAQATWEVVGPSPSWKSRVVPCAICCVVCPPPASLWTDVPGSPRAGFSATSEKSQTSLTLEERTPHASWTGCLGCLQVLEWKRLPSAENCKPSIFPIGKRLQLSYGTRTRTVTKCPLFERTRRGCRAYSEAWAAFWEVFNCWSVMKRGAPISLPTHHSQSEHRMSPGEFPSLKW